MLFGGLAKGQQAISGWTSVGVMVIVGETVHVMVMVRVAVIVPDTVTVQVAVWVHSAKNVWVCWAAVIPGAVSAP